MRRDHPNVHWFAHHSPDALVVILVIYAVVWAASHLA